MPWDEFCTLVGGLMPDTPLGGIVGIRAERDPKTIKAFTADQRRIYSEWRTRQANAKLADPERLDRELNNLIQAFSIAFGPGKEAR